MTNSALFPRLVITILALVLVFWLGIHSPIGPVEANLPLATPPSNPNPTPQLVWEGRIVSDTRYVTPPNGSILRVSVEELEGVPITVSAYDWSTTALSGSKTEYGPYMAEFAPLQPGFYTVSVESLGANLEITADGTNLIVVEFAQVYRVLPTLTPIPTPSPSLTPQPTSTPMPITIPTTTPTPTLLPPTPTRSESAASKPSPPTVWIPLPSLPTLIPSVTRASLPGLPTSLRIYAGSPARRATLLALPHSIAGQARSPTAPLPSPPTLTPTASAVISTPRLMPSPTATPAPRWMAQILRNTGGDTLGWRASVIAVQVIGLKSLPVELRSGSFSVTAFTGSKSEYGEFACEFAGLSAGTYEVIPQGLGLSQTITVDGGGFALIEFAYRLPPTPTPIPPQVVWKGKVVSNSSGQGANGVFSVVVVRVLGAKGLPVEISSGNWNATALTGTKPEYGQFACEFGGLWPGTYTVRPQGLESSVEITMDGQGLAIVEFTAH